MWSLKPRCLFFKKIASHEMNETIFIFRVKSVSNNNSVLLFCNKTVSTRKCNFLVVIL